MLAAHLAVLPASSALPALQTLLLAGGDERPALDASSGKTRYGSRPFPDPELVALGTVLALQQRWPQQVTVLVDTCQLRLSAQTVRAYLAQGFLVEITGSKFIGGPTFCGALLVPA